MRALVLDHTLRLETNYPTPKVPPGEALIRVLKAGICGTDLQLIDGYMGFTGVLGHEFVGIIEQSRDRKNLVGQRVVGEINAACRTCPTCLADRLTHCPHRTTLGINRRNGAFADYLCLPVENLHVLPDQITDDQAVFVEPLAAACQILQQVRVTPTDRVIVVGDGKLGLLCAQVLKSTGCHLSIVGHHPDGLAFLAQRGIRTVTHPDELFQGFDLVVEATGSAEGLRIAGRLVRPRGTLLVKSTYRGNISMDMTNFVINEVNLIGSRCGPFEPAIQMLQRGLVDVESLIHARYPLDRGLDAVECAGTKGSLKILLEMG